MNDECPACGARAPWSHDPSRDVSGEWYYAFCGRRFDRKKGEWEEEPLDCLRRQVKHAKAELVRLGEMVVAEIRTFKIDPHGDVGGSRDRMVRDTFAEEIAVAVEKVLHDAKEKTNVS